MNDGQCCKSFPKQFKDDTEENVNGYPIYRRRVTEPVQVGKYSIVNRWVVPYNPWLLNKLLHTLMLKFVPQYVRAPEAMWNLNEFSLSHKSHTVVRLAVHLPQQQPIVYQDGQEAQAIERAALSEKTLTSWFELNKNDPSVHNISYSDIPQYYVFDKSTTNWKKR
ncbi:hypothetical protein AVEN_234999-1 [Araneus ventricosus]|uniref:Uncharacterized protein n=1 Tax=Araneus ventricosus TaxID=182803 RepID=A0A4Y2FLD6_ARAVE|nr:hypothetical protein AVEN_234999-1 [Araneus ventricosus]